MRLSSKAYELISQSEWICVSQVDVDHVSREARRLCHSLVRWEFYLAILCQLIILGDLIQRKTTENVRLSILHRYFETHTKQRSLLFQYQIHRYECTSHLGLFYDSAKVRHFQYDHIHFSLDFLLMHPKAFENVLSGCNQLELDYISIRQHKNLV